jgi:hypothetical protein
MRKMAGWAESKAGLRPAADCAHAGWCCEADRAEPVTSGRGTKVGGPAVDFGCWAQNKNMPERVEGKRRKVKSFVFLKTLQPNEFKCKFEFKHTKPMHQHVCNIKLLWLIYFILENI